MEEYFNSDDGDYIFIHPSECVKAKGDDNKRGYVYKGIYQKHPSGRYVELIGVRVYESDNVAYEGGKNVYKNLKLLKSKSGKDLFSLEELAEFDYERTNKTWDIFFHNSKIKNMVQATKQVLNEKVRVCIKNQKNKIYKLII